MSYLFNLDPLLGGLGSEIPTEIMLIQYQDSLRCVDLLAFQLDVEKRIKILQLIAEEYLPDEAESEAIIMGQFSSKESETDQQRGIKKTEQLLIEKLTKEVVELFIPISSKATDTKLEKARKLEEAKVKLSKEIAEEVYTAQRKAKKFLSWGATRRRLCPSLKGFSDDVFEISKAIVPVLVPLSLTGTLAIPAQPMLYGWMALIGVRISIENLCKGYVEEELREDEFNL